MEVAVMANDDHHHHHFPSNSTSTTTTAYTSTSPTFHWSSQSPPSHIYPHSHHGTPAQEYSGFAFPSPQTSSNDTFQHNPIQSRPYAQLQPLVMPQWPSMLNHMPQGTYQSTMFPPPVQPVRSMSSSSITPISSNAGNSASSRTASNPRRTLTDHDRKQMCIYAEEHPNSKQTEIGALFGVERSTVSKVLRQKEKYLQQAEEPVGSKSPHKKQKPRAPDIERALAVWIKNQQRKGVTITDELIRDKARRFAATTTTPENHQVLSTSWLEKFKLRHNIMGARSRKSSLAPAEESEAATLSTSHSPNDVSPISPHQLLSSPVPSRDLHVSKSRDSLAGDCQGYVDFSGQHVPHLSQSSNSLNGAFSDSAALSPTSPVLFTPDSVSTSSPFVHTRPLFSASNAPPAGLGLGVGTSTNNYPRPRSQTFPLLDQYLNQETDDHASIMDSPMEEAPDPLLSIDHIVHHHQHPATISPEQTMRPPPLPAHILAPDVKRDSLRPAPSAEDACRAIEVVLDYFAQQPSYLLDMDESVYLGRLMDKVKLRSNSTS